MEASSPGEAEGVAALGRAALFAPGRDLGGGGEEMFMMVQCYDVLDRLHVRARMVDDSATQEILVEVLRLVMDAHRPEEVKSPRDLLAWLGESLIDMAHSDNPLL